MLLVPDVYLVGWAGRAPIIHTVTRFAKLRSGLCSDWFQNSRSRRRARHAVPCLCNDVIAGAGERQARACTVCSSQRLQAVNPKEAQRILAVALADIKKLELFSFGKCKDAIKMALVDGQSVSWAWHDEDWKRTTYTTFKLPNLSE